MPAPSGGGESVTAAIDRAISRMDWGNIGFNPPQHMQRGEVHELRLILSPSENDAEVQALLPSGGERESHRVRFSDWMEARLESGGTGLVVTPLTPDRQAVSGIEPTVWVWTIRADEGGDQSLRLTLDAILDVNGERVPRSIRTFSQTIDVSVSPWQRLASPGIAWPLAALLLVAAAFAIVSARRRRARPVYDFRMQPAEVMGHHMSAAVAAGASRDVFVSHSSRDSDVAQRICRALEADGLRCWLAPRDITPGKAWDEAIIDAIEQCRTMVLVLSEQSNASGQVSKEVRNAVEARVPVIPFRVEAVTLSKALRYHISSAHCLDAVEPPLERHLDHLVRAVREHLPDEASRAQLPLPAVQGRASGVDR